MFFFLFLITDLCALHRCCTQCTQYSIETMIKKICRPEMKQKQKRDIVNYLLLLFLLIFNCVCGFRFSFCIAFDCKKWKTFSTMSRGALNWSLSVIGKIWRSKQLKCRCRWRSDDALCVCLVLSYHLLGQLMWLIKLYTQCDDMR